ncbi:hypothetical protein MUK42_11936 [Musa troglodytarum]|uniref:Uncharacterized protein n=1 Tax=Musa troglodytarum TaxID=320322 RepID=A0A9E7GMJ2_9LILI|nr:hypothetical protein MUK42_11936 [Musa troglodytarum]
MPNWELKHCCDHDQSVFIVTIAVFTVVILAVSSSSPKCGFCPLSFPNKGQLLLLWRTVLLTPFKLITVFLHETSHALACKLTCGFIIFLAIVWLLQETTKVRILRFVILFIGVMNSLFSVYDIYDDLISRRVHSSDAEKFAEICPCPCNGVAWGVIWGLISFAFLCGSIYLGLVILS